MNNLKKILVCVSIPILSLLLIILWVEIKTNKALNDYLMLPDGQKVVDKAVLGSGTKNILIRLLYRIKPGVLELICTDKGNILLLMEDDVRYLTFYKRANLFTDFRIFTS